VKNSLFAYISIFVILIIVRSSSFFFSEYDWDESTLILMGQNILNGNIPYVNAWDIKPPGAYYIYALFIVLFGKSIIAIRLGGILCIFISSVFLYKTGKVIQNQAAGIISAIFLAVFTSSGYAGLSTMTEHILLIPISFILYLLLSKNINWKWAFIIGISLGFSILIKTNMIFESFAVCLVLLFTFKHLNFSDRLKNVFILVAGGSLPILAIGYFYFINNELNLLLKTNITIALTYAGIGGYSFLKNSFILFSNITDNMKINSLLWITFIIGAIYLFLSKKRENKFLLITMTLFLAQMVSLFLIGKPHGIHYLITSMPIMCLVSGVALSRWLSGKNISNKKVYPIATLLIITGLLYSLYSLDATISCYRKIYTQIKQKKPLLNDSCYQIASFLEKNNIKDQYIYVVNGCHIVYWLTDNKYPTKYIHPSNLLLREYILKIIDGENTSKEKELIKILSKDPKYIIYERKYREQPIGKFKIILEKELGSHYELAEIIDDNYHIYASKKSKCDYDR
jgi:hypothetical protein